MKAYIKAIAHYLPSQMAANEPGSRLTRKTGIHCRHIAAPDECASDLAVRAAENLFAGGVDKSSVDYVLLCTQSPDYILPTTACLIQDRLQLHKSCGALDFNLGCSGYIYGLSLAKGLVESGQARNVLFLTAETYSKYIQPGDGSVEPLFGDGATASLISAVETESEGIKGLVFGTDGSGADHLIVKGGACRQPLLAAEARREHFFIKMDGAKISQFALEVVPETVEQILSKCNLTKEELDFFVFHQANHFILSFLRTKCGLAALPFWNDVRNYGNTVSNSIPLALCDLLRGCVGEYRNVMLTGFGVGLSWGGCIVDLSMCLGESKTV